MAPLANLSNLGVHLDDEISKMRPLAVVGIASPEIIAKLPWHGQEAPNEIALFLSFPNQEVPIGQKFDRLENGELSLPINARLTGVTQQFFKAYDAIPAGWKTIALLEVEEGLEYFNSNLPVVEDWYEEEIQQYYLS